MLMWAPKPVIIDEELVYSCLKLKFPLGHRKMRVFTKFKNVASTAEFRL